LQKRPDIEIKPKIKEFLYEEEESDEENQKKEKSIIHIRQSGRFED